MIDSAPKKLNIWAINPYHNGSHLDFLKHWSSNSRYHWDVFSFPGCHWHWRFHHSALSLSKMLPKESLPDLIFCTSMLNLTQLLGLRPDLCKVPCLMYFHENQLTYPLPQEEERDMSLAFQQFVGAIAAQHVLFNSQHHMEQYFQALNKLDQKLPSPSLEPDIQNLEEKSSFLYPGIQDLRHVKKTHPEEPLTDRTDHDPITLLWCARWEKDKRPDLLIQTLNHLRSEDFSFKLILLGCQISKNLERDIEPFKEYIIQHGYCDTKEEYGSWLHKADLFISCAEHEYFGIAALEAALCGTQLLLPHGCVYPEVYKKYEGKGVSFHHHDPKQIAKQVMAHDTKNKNSHQELIHFSETFTWKLRSQIMDDKLEQMIGQDKAFER